MNAIQINALANVKKELKEISNAYDNLYLGFENEDLKIVFSSLHNQIIKDFKAMNERLPATERSYRYYKAENSRNLKEHIKIALRLEKELKNFTIDKYYKSIFDRCLGFLKKYGGSELPIGMDKIIIYEAIPIFISQNNIEIPINKEIVGLKPIGEGSYAKVFKYTDSFYNKKFALKRLKENVNEKEKQRFKIEFDKMKELKNPYILEVYSFNDSKQEYIMEYVDCTLEKFVEKNKLTKEQKRNLGLQILRAIEFLWSKDILHRDISYKNILIKEYDNDMFVVKISDFGLIKETSSTLTSENSDVKGSFNDISRLQKIGFGNYSRCEEIYALTRALYFVATNRTKINNPNCDFLNKGIDENIENRYKTLDELKESFLKFLKDS